jgi:hypothetical protein
MENPDPLLVAIVKRLKTGSIPNVFRYGDTEKMPPPPYVCVRPENDNGVRRVTMYAHRKPGEGDLIEAYTLHELTELMKSTDFDNRPAYGGNEWTDIIGNDDGTISMSRTFVFPYKIGP